MLISLRLRIGGTVEIEVNSPLLLHCFGWKVREDRLCCSWRRHCGLSEVLKKKTVSIYILFQAYWSDLVLYPKRMILFIFTMKCPLFGGCHTVTSSIYINLLEDIVLFLDPYAPRRFISSWCKRLMPCNWHGRRPRRVSRSFQDLCNRVWMKVGSNALSKNKAAKRDG